MPGLQPAAIRVISDSREDKLDPKSLVHYGKVYTIEHNVKVKPFGVVHDDSRRPLIEQFYRVWVDNIGLRKVNVSSSARSVGGTAHQPLESSGVAQSRLPQEPRSLTQQQRAAIEVHSNAVESRAQMDRRSSNADRRSVRSSTRDSDTTAVSSGVQEEIRTLYLTMVSAAEEQGLSTEVAEAVARRKIELTYPNLAGNRSAISSAAGAPSRSASQATTRGTSASTSTNIEAAIAALVERGFSREEAVERLREGLLAQQDPQTGPSSSRAKGKGKGKAKD